MKKSLKHYKMATKSLDDIKHSPRLEALAKRINKSADDIAAGYFSLEPNADGKDDVDRFLDTLNDEGHRDDIKKDKK